MCAVAGGEDWGGDGAGPYSRSLSCNAQASTHRLVFCYVNPTVTPPCRRSWRFVYSGVVDSSGPIAALRDILAVSHYYVLTPLKERLERGLLTRVNKDSVAALLQSAHRYDCHALKEACQEYIAEHFTELQSSLASSLAESPELLLEIAAHFNERSPKRRRTVVVE